MQKNDYCVGQVRNEKGRRTFLLKVSSVTKGIVSGVLEKDSHVPGRKTLIEVPSKDILVNLGNDPAHGKVYGVDVSNRFSGKNIHEHFGPVYWMYTPEREVGRQLMLAFDKAWKVLKHNRLDFIIDQDSCIWEILPYEGEKYAGMYKRMKNASKSPHRLQIRPECMPASDYVYVVIHELAHHMDCEYMKGTKIRAAWIRLFNTSIKLQTIRKDQSVDLMEALLEGEIRPTDFKSSLSEEDTLVYKLILQTIQKNTGLSPKELDVLFEADCKDDIRTVWPARSISKKELAPVISEYSTKNYRETIAEAVSFHLTGKKLPANVVKLLEKTYSYCRTQAEKEQQ